MTQYDLTKSDGTVRMDISELVARDGRTYIFVDDLFYHDSGLHGATGSRMVPVFQEEVDRRMDELRDYEWSGLAHIYDEQDPEESWDEWIDTQIRREGVRLILDESYVATYGETVKDRHEQEHGDRPQYVECIGGGRMFSRSTDYEQVFRDDLLRMIHDAESDDPEWVTPHL